MQRLTSTAHRYLALKPLHFKQLPQLSALPIISSASSSTVPPTPAEAQAKFWEKNAQLARPMSPWMIYKIQLTSFLSISHRITGTGLGVLMYGWGINSCFRSTPWATQLESLAAIFPSWTLYTLKVLIATSAGYHLVNGIRHLLWDLGYGFKLNELYTSGYFALGLTLIIALLAIYNA